MRDAQTVLKEYLARGRSLIKIRALSVAINNPELRALVEVEIVKHGNDYTNPNPVEVNEPVEEIDIDSLVIAGDEQ